MDKDLFFTVNTNSTQSNELKLYKNQFKTSIRGDSFSQRIINNITGTSYPLKLYPHLMYLIFKTKLDLFLYDHRFDCNLAYEIGFIRHLSFFVPIT